MIRFVDWLDARTAKMRRRVCRLTARLLSVTILSMPESRIRVLLVEDDRIFADLLSKQFSHRNAEVIHAGTGKEALSALQGDGKFDVILLDISLPDIDGFEVLSRIQGEPLLKAIPVVVISNFAQEKDIEWGRNLGVKQFVKKISVMPIEIVDIAFQHCPTAQDY